MHHSPAGPNADRSFAVLMATAALALAACGLSAGPGPTPSPGTHLQNACTGAQADPLTCSSPPPGWTLPSPLPCDRPLRTSDEIKAAVRPSQPQSPATSWVNQLGEPISVRALQIGRADTWLVPHLVTGGGAEWISVVEVAGPQRGCLVMGSGWAGPFPRLDEGGARARADVPGDPVRSIEAVFIPQLRGFALPYASEVAFVWRVVRASGSEVFVFTSGEVIAGTDVRAAITTHLPGVQLRV